MAKFEIKYKGKKYRITAKDKATALSTFKKKMKDADDDWVHGYIDASQCSESDVKSACQETNCSYVILENEYRIEGERSDVEYALDILGIDPENNVWDKKTVKDDDYGVMAWNLNQVISSMNNEDAYFGSWLYIYPDGETRDQCLEDFADKESYDDLKETFDKVYKRYHKDGLYTNDPEVIEFAHKMDAELGLPQIEVIKPVRDSKKVKDSKEYVLKYPYPYEWSNDVWNTFKDYCEQNNISLFAGDDVTLYNCTKEQANKAFKLLGVAPSRIIERNMRDKKSTRRANDSWWDDSDYLDISSDSEYIEETIDRLGWSGAVSINNRKVYGDSTTLQQLKKELEETIPDVDIVYVRDRKAIKVSESTILYLIGEEKNAIKDYEKAIAETPREVEKQLYRHILEEEYEHLDELNNLLNNKVKACTYQISDFSDKDILKSKYKLKK